MTRTSSIVDSAMGLGSMNKDYTATRSLYSSFQKYVPIGLREHASALAGLTIVEPSEGSLR
jgi:hypothetical protein